MWVGCARRAGISDITCPVLPAWVGSDDFLECRSAFQLNAVILVGSGRRNTSGIWTIRAWVSYGFRRKHWPMKWPIRTAQLGWLDWSGAIKYVELNKQ
jgi:hypothetical protein